MSKRRKKKAGDFEKEDTRICKRSPGRPVGKGLNFHLQQAIEEYAGPEMAAEVGPKFENVRAKNKELIIEVLIREAIRGQAWAHHIIWDRIEGPLKRDDGAGRIPADGNMSNIFAGWSEGKLEEVIKFLTARRLQEARVIEHRSDAKKEE